MAITRKKNALIFFCTEESYQLTRPLPEYSFVYVWINEKEALLGLIVSPSKVIQPINSLNKWLTCLWYHLIVQPSDGYVSLNASVKLLQLSMASLINCSNPSSFSRRSPEDKPITFVCKQNNQEVNFELVQIGWCDNPCGEMTSQVMIMRHI